MRCDELGIGLAEVADDAVTLPSEARRHVDQCLRCQAELAQYRKMLRAGASMRDDLVEPPAGSLDAILERLDEVGDQNVLRSLLDSPKAKYLGGIAAATAAGAAGAILVAARSRRGRVGIAS